MACIIKKKNKYSTYYVIAESGRINGKPRIVKQLYLGTIERLIAFAEGKAGRTEPEVIDCVDESPGVLFRIAGELGIRDLVNGTVAKRRQGMTPGDYILLASLNRALSAVSKTRIGEWVEGTCLYRYMEIDRGMLSSQNFWDHFDKFGEKDIEKIGDEICHRAVELERIPLDCLIYDTTNYFNYWDVLNPSELARMTKSKAGKNSLRHIGLALAVDREHGFPVLHRLYPANRHDSVMFRELLDEMFRQISGMVSDKKAATFVFDKGNNSEEAILKLDESRHHFIGTRSTWHHKDLCTIPLDRYREVEVKEGFRLPVYETTLELYGKPRRVLLVYNEVTYRRKLHRLEHHLERAKEELSFFKRRAKGADGRSTQESIRRAAEEITQRFHVGGLLDLDVMEEESGYRVSARKNFPAIEELKTRFGKQLLFTNRESLAPHEIIKAYLDRYIVEEAFRITKSDHWVKWDPAFHWTDSKIRVHALTCVIALLLVKIAHKRAKEKGFAHGPERMLKLLSGVKSAMLHYRGSRKPTRKLCSLSDEQQELLTILSPDILDRM